MCGINAVINGTLSNIYDMQKAASKRGIKKKLHHLRDAFIYFDWLPITDNNAPEQPFQSGKVLVFMNGYISNYLELSEKHGLELETDCDTELLAKFLDKYKGKRLEELNGFFAVLWHDGNKWKAFTDRYGIKQLYWYEDGDTKFISSEVKTILNACEVNLSPFHVNRYKYSLGVLNKDTIYSGVNRVKKLPFVVPGKIDISYEYAKVKLKELLDKSIERNRTNLKSGVFLSGGVDSGLIAKLVQPDYCFSMDYINTDYSEIDNIKLNSTSTHYVMMCNDSVCKENVINIIDDPKAGSCYTNVSLTEFASKFCTVLYSGAGGDEFFGGYPHRLNKPIEVVQKRTKYEGKPLDITHFDYDLMFLDSILVVEDSIGGYYTMETRYPLLDNDLVDFALSLPDEYKEGKRILKDISGLNEKVLNSPKKGFSNPVSNDEWVDFSINYIKEKYGFL